MNPLRELLAELKAIRQELAGIREALEKKNATWTFTPNITTGTTTTIPAIHYPGSNWMGT